MDQRIEHHDARLILEDGTIFTGRSVGAAGETSGEVVFNTCMTGYQEVITDPSYRGQIVVMTQPHIGNTGVNEYDGESERIRAEGFIVRELSDVTSSWRARESLAARLRAEGVVAMDGVDTRALTRRIRTAGAMTGVMSTTCVEPETLRRRVAAAPRLVGRDLVAEVTRGRRIEWTEGFPPWLTAGDSRAEVTGGPRVVALDCGAKANIFRALVDVGFRVIVLPSGAGAAEILAEKPDALFLSNGPGDPEALPYLAETVRSLLGRLPLFGICLGHQILGLALGGRIVKLRFGHHGGNQPVKDLATGRIEITSQNHGFATDRESLAGTGAEVTHVNLNDGTVEGLASAAQRAFSVQYHPEAAPGPHDALHLFHRFRAFVDRGGRFA